MNIFRKVRLQVEVEPGEEFTHHSEYPDWYASSTGPDALGEIDPATQERSAGIRKHLGHLSRDERRQALRAVDRAREEAVRLELPQAEPR
jgi:hypothetical protein